MNMKVLGAVLCLVVVIFSVFVISVLTNDSTGSEYKDDQDYSSDDLLNELDESLLDENGEIEIGEMV